MLIDHHSTMAQFIEVICLHTRDDEMFDVNFKLELSSEKSIIHLENDFFEIITGSTIVRLNRKQLKEIIRYLQGGLNILRSISKRRSVLLTEVMDGWKIEFFDSYHRSLQVVEFTYDERVVILTNKELFDRLNVKMY